MNKPLVTNNPLGTQPTLSEIASKAMETFHRNADTIVAGFLIRHPDVDPADVELVFAPGKDGALHFTIEPKELHVPPAKEESAGPDSESLYSSDFVEGWNACRDAMIAKAKEFRAPEAMVSTLEDANGQ